MQRIYLDNAATSWPKPPGVAEAMADYLNNNGAPAGRSGYAEANAAQRIVVDCRRRLAALIHAQHPRDIAIAFNGTDALNLAIHGVLRPGDHVIATTLEHNSVLRPLQHWRRHHGVTVTYLSPGPDGRVSAAQLTEALRDETRLAAITHASNVTGVIQPVADWGRVIASHGSAVLLVDAAQSLGHLPIHVQDLGADLLAASTHKGVRGPLGTGMLYVGPRATDQVMPWRQGGTGTESEDADQPMGMPERLESGNLNMVGIAGLAAALQSLDPPALQANLAHEQQLTHRLLIGLDALDGCTIRSGGLPLSAPASERTSVVSVTVDGIAPQELAMLLDVSFRVQTRAGLHCSPWAHCELGTLDSGGTLRFSLGPDNTNDHVDIAVQAVAELTGMA